MQVVWNNNIKPNQGIRMENRELAQYFREELFIPNLQATNKKESFNELAELFVNNKMVRSKDIVLEMLNQREMLGSTGIGKGIAIPHGRTTAALDVQIAFGKSPKGIAFKAVDKRPVKLIFVVIAPPHDENNRYLPVLGKLVEVVHNEVNRKKLMKVQTFEEFIQTIEGEA